MSARLIAARSALAGVLIAARPALAGVLLATLVLAPAARPDVLQPALNLPTAGSVYDSVRAPHCSLPGARTIVANRHVRIFNATYRKHGGLTFGCLRRSDRAFVIGIAGECQNNDVIDTAVVAGTLAALNVHTCGLATSESRIAVVTLTNGHVVFASAPLSTPGDESGHDAIRGMVLTPRGRLAWLAVRVTGGRGSAPVAAEVRRRAHGPDRESVLVDSGTGIDPRSLRRRGGRATWVKDGARRSASM